MTTTPAPIPKYRVVELSLIGNELHQAGAIVEYDGLPAENLEPLCDLGRAKYQEYLASNAARIERMHAEYPEELAEQIGSAILDAVRRGAGNGQVQTPINQPPVKKVKNHV